MPERFYLDNAATSWPKPEAVYAAVERYQRQSGAPAGRSSYQMAGAAGRIVTRARTGIARLLNAESADRIVFAAGGTDALNLAIHGILRPGDHVVTTVCEHNSVLRPLMHWIETAGAEVTYVPCDDHGVVATDDVHRALRADTRLVVVIHGSNVTGALQPIGVIAQAARDAGAFSLIDAAQTAGHVPIDLQALGVDLLAAPGHKGLLGPLGTGLLYVRPGVEKHLQTVRQGGTGSHSDEDHQPLRLPDKYESGNLNVLGLAGLAAAIEFLHERTIAALEQQQRELTTRLISGLEPLVGVKVHGPPASEKRLPVVSFTVDDYDPQDVAAMLDATYGVECRAGLHCAGRMHRALGTLETGGTVRLSLGWASTAEEIDHALRALREISN